MMTLLELAESWAATPSVLIASGDRMTTERLWNVLWHFDCDVSTQLMPDKMYGAAFVDTETAPLMVGELKRKRIPVVLLLGADEPVPWEFGPVVVLNRAAITLAGVKELVAMLKLRAPQLERKPALCLASAVA